MLHVTIFVSGERPQEAAVFQVIPAGAGIRNFWFLSCFHDTTNQTRLTSPKQKQTKNSQSVSLGQDYGKPYTGNKTRPKYLDNSFH